MGNDFQVPDDLSLILVFTMNRRLMAVQLYIFGGWRFARRC
tara:strand:- start:1744 stop:1866 length:123 start_codon:yes stop_codon:yes gene_type:complete